MSFHTVIGIGPVLLGVAAFLAAIPVIARVRCEYDRAQTLSDTTVAAVWVLYTAIVAVVVVATLAGSWAIGLPSLVSILLGACLLAAGLSLEAGGLASMASFRRMSGKQPDRLITGGAFRLSRNPQNVGIAIAMTGASFLGDSWVALLATAGFWLFFYAYVRFEEEHLGRVFGERYERYRRRTPRFLGLPGRRPSPV